MFLSIFMAMNNVITLITIRKCASELKLDTCYLKHTTSDEGTEFYTYYYGKCDSGEKCFLAGEAYKCMTPKRLLRLNEECVVGSECESGLCKNEKCSYSEEGEPCGYNQCGPGLYCKKQTNSEDVEYVCAKSSLENEYCSDDNKCVPYLECGNDSKCVKKFSLEDGTETRSDDACKSGFATDIFGGDKSVCASVTVNDECDSKQKCTLIYSAGDEVKERETSCDSIIVGKTLRYICIYDSASPERKQYIKLYKERFEELNKEELLEIEDYKSLDSKEVKKAYVMYYYLSKLFYADQCVIDYYMAEEGLNSQGMISFKKILLIGLIVLLI